MWNTDMHGTQNAILCIKKCSTFYENYVIIEEFNNDEWMNGTTEQTNVFELDDTNRNEIITKTGKKNCKMKRSENGISIV